MIGVDEKNILLFSNNHYIIPTPLLEKIENSLQNTLTYYLNTLDMSVVYGRWQIKKRKFRGFKIFFSHKISRNVFVDPQDSQATLYNDDEEEIAKAWGQSVPYYLASLFLLSDHDSTEFQKMLEKELVYWEYKGL